jgi:Ca2+/Na+ antiporter
MTFFNKIYLSIFYQLKDKYKQKANTIALWYTSILQITLLFLAGCFFATFLAQMNAQIIGQSKAITFFVIAALVIHFSNWMSYSGKQRKQMNATYIKQKNKHYDLKVLTAVPFIAVLFGFLLLQSMY